MTDATQKLRLKTIELEWPALLGDGRTITTITLHRLTGGEVAELQEAMTGDNATDAAMIAAFADQPAGVIAALDADDFMELKEAVVDFLPKRIRSALEAVLRDEAAAAEDTD